VITTTTAWNTKNNAAAKMPIYALTLAGQFGASEAYTTHDLARCGVTGYPAYNPWLKTPQGASQSIDIVNGSSSIGSLQCEIVDDGGAVRELIGANVLEGSAATLTVGYPGLAWTDFAVLHTYVVYSIVPTDGYTSWLFTCRDQQLLEKRTIYLHPENGGLMEAGNPWYLCGTPAEIFQSVVLFALRLPASTIDRATMIALDSAAEGNFAPWRPFQFALTASFEAKQFLETEVFKTSGLYQVVLPDGRLSLRSMRPPAAGPAPVFAFTQDNLIALPQWNRQPIVNEAIWQFDYDGSGYANYDTYIQATSVSLYGQGQQFTVASQGLRTELGAFGYAEWVTDRLFRRFCGVAPGIKGGAPLLTCKAMLMTLPVWVGDFVSLTHPLVPDITTGAKGVTNRILEVVDREPDYAAGNMQYKLLDTGLTGLPAAHQFGASSARPFLIGTSPIY
jgi:hypothetical protein